MVEPEIAYCDIEEDMQWAENLLIYIINEVLENRLYELNTLERDIDILRDINTYGSSDICAQAKSLNI